MTNIKDKKTEVTPVAEAMGVAENVAIEMKTPSFKNGVVICQNLNIKKEPIVGSEILQIIHKDAEVEIVSDVSTDWYKVNIGGIKEGFCMKEFITIK